MSFESLMGFGNPMIDTYLSAVGCLVILISLGARYAARHSNDEPYYGSVVMLLPLGTYLVATGVSGIAYENAAPLYVMILLDIATFTTLVWMILTVWQKYKQEKAAKSAQT
jgi:hypothetical protein